MEIVFFIFVNSHAILLCFADLSEKILIKRNEVHKNNSKVLKSLLKNYDKRDRPFVGEKETEIKLSLAVISFGEFKEANMEFTMQLHIRQIWVDPRLSHHYNTSLTCHLQEDINKLWLPDIYMVNAKKVVRDDLWLGIISPSGQVYFTYLATVTFSCHMEFVNYPMDIQVCPIVIESYGHTSEQLVYKWLDDGSVSMFENNLAEFEITDIKMSDNKTVQYISGLYNRLEASFTFSRRMGYYLIQIYIPCLLIVTVSWTIFWMDQDAVTDRAALGVSSVLSIVFLLGTSNSTMPRVSYIKAIDWFMIISFVFVFCAIIECVIVYKIVDKKKKNKTQRRAIKEVLENDHVNDTSSSNEKVELEDNTNLQQHENHSRVDDENKPKRQPHSADYALVLDIFFRLIFPLAYALFNLGYWVSYLNAYN